jgi:hypothetical protein
MTFNVDITFLGLFAVVPDNATPTKVALVVPPTDASDVKDTRKAQDDKPLYRHRWFIEFNPAQLPSAQDVPRDMLAHWTISEPKKFKRLTFITPGAAAFDASTALQSVFDFAQVAPKYADIPSKLLRWPTDEPPPVGGQIMFDKGRLVPPEQNEQWIVPGTLTGDGPFDQSANHRIHLRFENVSRFALRTQRVRDGEAQVLDLVPTDELPVVKVTICNLCDVNPLRWKTAGPRRIDDDYRWYYQLINDPEDTIKRDLSGLDLPVPHPSGQANALGQNCLSTQFNPQTFTID